jgi:hypothetical protein
MPFFQPGERRPFRAVLVKCSRYQPEHDSKRKERKKDPFHDSLPLLLRVIDTGFGMIML